VSYLDAAQAQLQAFAASQPPDNYVFTLACGHEHDSPSCLTADALVTCSVHGSVRVVEGPFLGQPPTGNTPTTPARKDQR